MTTLLTQIRIFAVIYVTVLCEPSCNLVLSRILHIRCHVIYVTKIFCENPEGFPRSFLTYHYVSDSRHVKYSILIKKKGPMLISEIQLGLHTSMIRPLCLAISFHKYPAVNGEWTFELKYLTVYHTQVIYVTFSFGRSFFITAGYLCKKIINCYVHINHLRSTSWIRW